MNNTYYQSPKEVDASSCIFVFGSNTSGRHGKGAAKYAKDNYGAVYGIGSGLTGRAYAIPTKTELADRSLAPMAVRDVVPYIQEFVQFTKDNPDKIFYVTAVGCGLAGNHPRDIAPHFKGAINCYLPFEFKPYLETANELWFRKTRAEGGFCSNFYPCEFEYKGKLWKSSEHAYQAMKFWPANDLVELIRNQPSAWHAATEGRNPDLQIRFDWNAVKDSVMFEVLKEKFFQNKDLGDMLLATGDRILIELSINDHYWGRHPDGRGLNKLGETLMRIRDLLRKNKDDH